MPDALRSDHRAIAEQLDDEANASHTHEALIAREQLVMRLVGHFVAEEQYLYPAVREQLQNGDARADAAFSADRRCEHQLKALEDDDLPAEQLLELWRTIGAEFRAHTDRQEPMFTELTAACSPQQLAELGDDVIGAEQLAPTRPRLLAIESAGANKITSLVEGYLDHVRDYYTKRGVEG
jgi:hypothetical protein